MFYIFTSARRTHRLFSLKLEEFGRVWKSLEEFGRVWKSLEEFGRVWISLEGVWSLEECSNS
jgi:hypothetical protein